MSALWVAVLAAAIGGYLLELAGVSLPESVLSHPTVQRVARFLPIAMLSALVAVELFDGGGRYAVDWRTLASVYARCMTRTNIDIDDELVETVMKQNGLKTKKDAVDFALRKVVRRIPTIEEIRSLRGIGFAYTNDEIEASDRWPGQ